MSHRTLIQAAELQTLLATGPAPVLLDCGFELADGTAGRRAYEAGHLPGAWYAHLEADLSGPKSTAATVADGRVGNSGRHPLPSRTALAATVARWGVRPGVQVVCYDDQASPYAARAWWLLRWLGHHEVAVLDGGRAAWRALGGEFTTALPESVASAASAASPTSPAPYPALSAGMPHIDAATLQQRLGQGRLFDARAGERFRGEVEPLDPVAGHIPGATLRFFKDNLLPDGRFKPAAQLAAEFDALGASGLPALALVHQCGSGVTACHNLLAMAHAGFGDTVLYPGSWSEWCSDPARPMVRRRT